MEKLELELVSSPRPATSRGSPRSSAISMAPSPPPATPSRQWGFLSSVLVLTPYLLALGFISTYLHYTLPTPQQELSAPDGITPIFSENQAMRYIYDMSTYPDGSSKYRIVGTEEMVETEVYLLAAIEDIKREVAEKMEGLHEIEVWHQVGSGSHLFDFMDKMVSWPSFTLVAYRKGLMQS